MWMEMPSPTATERIARPVIEARSSGGIALRRRIAKRPLRRFGQHGSRRDNDEHPATQSTGGGGNSE